MVDLSSVDAEIAAIESHLLSSTIQSASQNGHSVSHQSLETLQRRLDHLRHVRQMLSGDRSLIERGRVTGIGEPQ